MFPCCLFPLVVFAHLLFAPQLPFLTETVYLIKGDACDFKGGIASSGQGSETAGPACGVVTENEAPSAYMARQFFASTS